MIMFSNIIFYFNFLFIFMFQLETNSEKARFSKEIFRKATSFAWKSFRKRSKTIYRWFKLLSVIGVDALPDDKLKKVSFFLTNVSLTGSFAYAIWPCAVDPFYLFAVHAQWGAFSSPHSALPR